MSTGPGRPTSHGAGLLETWLQHPLDPGYAEAAARKAAAASGRSPADDSPAPTSSGDRRWRPDAAWTAAGCILVGLVLVIAYLQANREAPTDARTRADLRARISEAQKNGDQLESAAQSLDARVNARRTLALGGGSDTALTRAEAQGGTIAVQGPGIRVTLGNPPAPTGAATTGRAGTTPIGAVSDLTDTDVRAIVNELWIDGSEAISVNGIRLTPISAIRFAGQVVLVDFQPVTSPYTIDAIGDSNQLITSFTSSSVAGRYRTLASADGFAFASSQSDRLTMAANVVADPHYASIDAPEPTPTPIATPTPTSPASEPSTSASRPAGSAPSS